MRARGVDSAVIGTVFSENMYFVKWAGLSYLECTWEWESDLGNDPHIAEFHRHNVVPHGAIPIQVTLRPRVDDGAAQAGASPVARGVLQGVETPGRPVIDVSGLSPFMQALFDTVNRKQLKQGWVLLFTVIL